MDNQGETIRHSYFKGRETVNQPMELHIKKNAEKESTKYGVLTRIIIFANVVALLSGFSGWFIQKRKGYI
jgi:hypothetical protein